MNVQKWVLEALEIVTKAEQQLKEEDHPVEDDLAMVRQALAEALRLMK